MTRDLRIFATGGTIDKIHDPIAEILTFPDQSVIPVVLKQAKAGPVPVETLMLKDSLEVSDEDRAIMANAINQASEAHIVVTHGTSTMAKTAEYLKNQCADKVVVLTGAMRPFSLYESDAKYNLGAAMTAAQILPPGVYITMNGQVFDAGAVTKNTSLGVFEAIS